MRTERIKVEKREKEIVDEKYKVKKNQVRKNALYDIHP